jgi:hypothetical protein
MAQTAVIYVTTSGNDSTCVRGDSTHPCLSFQGAYAKASPGDSVQVAAGTYAAQNLVGTLGTPAVTFVGAPGSAYTAPCISGGVATTCSYGVILNSLSITGNNITIQGMAMKFDSTSLKPGGIYIGNNAATTYTTNNIVLNKTSSQTMFIVGAANITLENGDNGNYDPCQTSTADEDGIDMWVVNSGVISTNHTTVSSMVIHDVTDHNNECAGLPGAGRHVDCIQYLAGHYITIQNSVFYNCPTDNFIARPYLDTMDNFTIVNNFFGPVMNPGNGELMGASGDTVGGTNIYRFNTSLGPGPNTATTGTFTIDSNIIPEWACVNATYTYNVFWTGVGCGTNSKTGFSTSAGLSSTPTQLWRNGLIPNYNLTSDSTSAHAAGNPSSYPATDIHGTTRLSPPDAGADQYVGGTQTSTPPATVTTSVH